MPRRLPILMIAAAIAILGTPALVAAAEPTLTATVIPGQEIDVVGAGFPADADVQLAILRNGADDGTQALHTDATGGFTATIDAGPGRGGVYTMTATSGSASATVEALAVETAGGLHSSPPPTDTVPGGPGSGLSIDRLAVLALIGAGVVSVALSAFGRRARA
ncbi:MAG TPA: hypothetical protein VIU37_05770 [Candidatus Limnocylindrales bacterium]